MGQHFRFAQPFSSSDLQNSQFRSAMTVPAAALHSPNRFRVFKGEKSEEPAKFHQPVN